MLCTHKTTIFCQFGNLEICPNFANPYLTQFSSISGGNCVILQELNFKPSKADPDVWMRPEPGGTCYEYIAVYVDDLAIAAKDPQAFCNELKKKHNLKLKGVGPLEYHLGCTYKKDPDGTLAADPRRYVNKILESYERMFKEKPRKSRPPLEGGDHPELDTSELCD